MELRRRRFELPDGSTDVAVDDLVDVAGAAVSLAAREMCCRAAIDSGSFARAAANLRRLAGLELSDEKLRQVAEAEGRSVLAWQEDGQLELDFDAGTWVTAETGETGGGATTSRAYVGIDGFLLPVVTDAEAGKRHDAAAARRRTLKRRRGLRRPRLKRRRGADQRYKELKLVTVYDQDKEHRLARATRGGVDRAGRMLRQVAGDVRLRRARQVAAVADGAEWIARLVDDNLPRDATVVLDYYHASQHVHQARRAVFGESGESAPDGLAWAQRVLEQLRTRPFDEPWQTLVQTRARVRARCKRRALDDLMRYLGERRAKVDYARFRAAGLDIGSGPTESMCKSLSRRMKGVGMRWTAANAEAIVALEALHQSDLWPVYWSSQLTA